MSEEEYPESPCKTCLVYAICNELCPETNKYMNDNELMDSYAGKVLSRVINLLESQLFGGLFRNEYLTITKYAHKKIEKSNEP